MVETNFDRIEITEIKSIFREMLRREGPVGAPVGGPGGAPGPAGPRPKPGDQIRGRTTVAAVAARQQTKRRRRRAQLPPEKKGITAAQILTAARIQIGLRAPTRTGVLQALGISLRGVSQRVGAGIGFVKRPIGFFTGRIAASIEQSIAGRLARLEIENRPFGLSSQKLNKGFRARRAFLRGAGAAVPFGVRSLGTLGIIAAGFEISRLLGTGAIPLEATAARTQALGALSLSTLDDFTRSLGGAETLARFSIESAVVASQAIAGASLTGQSPNRSLNDFNQALWANQPFLHPAQQASLEEVRDRFNKQTQYGNFYGGWKGNDTTGP